MKQSLFNLKKELNNMHRDVSKALSRTDFRTDRKYINFLLSELDRIQDVIDNEEIIEKELAKTDKKHFFDSFSFYILKKNIKNLRHLLSRKRI